MNLIAEAHACLRREIINLLVHSSGKDGYPATDTDVIGHSIREAGKEQLVVSKVAVSLLEHLRGGSKEQPRRIGVGEPVRSVMQSARVMFANAANVVDRQSHAPDTGLEIDGIIAQGDNSSDE